MPNALNILAFEPFYGGSHKAFIDGWIKHSSHHWELLTLPDENWRWRNRNAAVTLSTEVEQVLESGFKPDLIFTTSMIDTSTLISLLPRKLRTLPVITLFHENQLHYPLRSDNGRRHIDAVLNDYKSALASDQVWWNSDYNRKTLLENLPEFFKTVRIEDTKELHRNIDKINKKSQIIPLGIDKFEPKFSTGGEPVHIVWAARWEHDKNPEEFFRALNILKTKGFNFKLSVIGEKTIGTPKCFNWAKERFKDEIINWGFLPNRTDYINCLQNAEIVVSTSKHEFFGLSIFEAVSAGCLPILPNRVVYPELFTDFPQCIYQETTEAFIEKLEEFITLYETNLTEFNKLQKQVAAHARQYHWHNAAHRLDQFTSRLT